MRLGSARRVGKALIRCGRVLATLSFVSGCAYSAQPLPSAPAEHFYARTARTGLVVAAGALLGKHSRRYLGQDITGELVPVYVVIRNGTDSRVQLDQANTCLTGADDQSAPLMGAIAAYRTLYPPSNEPDAGTIIGGVLFVAAGAFVGVNALSVASLALSGAEAIGHASAGSGEMAAVALEDATKDGRGELLTDWLSKDLDMGEMPSGEERRGILYFVPSWAPPPRRLRIVLDVEATGEKVTLTIPLGDREPTVQAVPQRSRQNPATPPPASSPPRSNHSK